MTSCDYCRHLSGGLDGCQRLCNKDQIVKITPEGVKEKEYVHAYASDSLAYFREHNGGRCPYYSSMGMYVWKWLMEIGLGVIAVLALKRFLS